MEMITIIIGSSLLYGKFSAEKIQNQFTKGLIEKSKKVPKSVVNSFF